MNRAFADLAGAVTLNPSLNRTHGGVTRFVARIAVSNVIIGLGADARAEDAAAEHVACSAMKQKVATVSRLLPSGPSDKGWSGWFCDFANQVDGYYVIALRSNRPAPYSNLMGWYAVQLSTGSVFAWDLNDQKAVPLQEAN